MSPIPTTSAPPRRSAPLNGERAALSRLSAVLRAGEPPSRMLRRVLGVLTEAFESPYAILELRRTGAVLTQTIGDDTPDADFWRSPCEALLTEALSDQRPIGRIFRSEEHDLGGALLAVPVHDASGEPVGAVCLVCPNADADEAQDRLHGLIGYVDVVGLHLEDPTPEGETDAESDKERNDLLKRLAGYASPVELAFTITNNIRNRMGCEVVALGLVRKGRVRVASVSGMDTVKQSSPLITAKKAAMEEMLDFQHDIVLPGSEGRPHDHETPRLHRQWHERLGGAPIASLPLRVDDEIRAVLLLQRSMGRVFSDEELTRVRQVVTPYISGLALLERASQGLAEHVWIRTRKFARTLFVEGRSTRRIAVAAALAFVTWFCFGTLDYRVSVPGTVTASLVQHLGAPYEGVIRTAPLAAGDAYRAGDILCTFDTTTLELEHSRLTAELEIAELEEQQARASGSTFDVELTRLRKTHLAAVADMVALQIDRSVLRAPFDGIVLSGDLRQRVGDAVTQGEALFELAATAGWTLELSVPEAEVLGLEAGQVGAFATRARPEERHELTVQRVHPMVEQTKQGAVVLAEATSDDLPTWVRPGMMGVARVDVGPRRVWWVALHSMVNAVRIRFWV